MLCFFTDGDERGLLVDSNDKFIVQLLQRHFSHNKWLLDFFIPPSLRPVHPPVSPSPHPPVTPSPRHPIPASPHLPIPIYKAATVPATEISP